MANIARERKHSVSKSICRQCQFLDDCRKTGYKSQFRKPGVLVAANEMAASGEYLEEAELVIFDDAALQRSMLNPFTLTDRDLRLLLDVEQDQNLRRVLRACRDAISDHPTKGRTYSSAVWDALARVVGNADTLIEWVRGLPPARDQQPSRLTPTMPIRVRDVERVPVGGLSVLIDVLQNDVEAYASGQEFTSCLSLTSEGITARVLTRQPTGDDGGPLLAQAAVLVLDATPVLSLVETLTSGLEALPTVEVAVELPNSVHVVQHADYHFGKASLTREVETGKVSGFDVALDLISEHLKEADDAVLGAVCHKDVADKLVRARSKIPRDRILTYFGTRGRNDLEDSTLCFLIGRPQSAEMGTLLNAYAVHAGEQPPLDPSTRFTTAPYVGYRHSDGKGRASYVWEYQDARVRAFLTATRDDELHQGLHRFRLYRVGYEGDPRSKAKAVVITAHPLPGLRVDELVYDEDRVLTNDQRAGVALRKALRAIEGLRMLGIPISQKAVIRTARCSVEVARRAIEAAADLVGGYEDASMRSITGPLPPPPNLMEAEADAADERRAVRRYGDLEVVELAIPRYEPTEELDEAGLDHMSITGDWDWFSLPNPDGGRWELVAVEAQLHGDIDPEMFFLDPRRDAVTVDTIIIAGHTDDPKQRILLDQEDVRVYLRSCSEIGLWAAYVRYYDTTWRAFKWQSVDELLPGFFEAWDRYRGTRGWA